VVLGSWVYLTPTATRRALYAGEGVIMNFSGSDGLLVTPEKMTVIVNLLAMFRKLGNTDRDAFSQLERIGIDELRLIQDDLIPEYNKAVKL